MKVIINKNVEHLTYEEICEKLGFIASVGFIEVTSTGRIGFSIGKPNEILALWKAIRDNKMEPSRGLVSTVRQEFNIW